MFSLPHLLRPENCLKSYRLIKLALNQRPNLASIATTCLNLKKTQKMTTANDKSKWALVKKLEREKHQFDSLRKWEHEDHSASNIAEENDTPFTFMSYNILAQDLLTGHMDLYQDHDKSALLWSQRYDRLMVEIHKINPDFLCLQELQESNAKQFRAGLKLMNYDMLFKKRTGGKSDGCAIFYNKDLFDLVQYHDVEFAQPTVELLNRDNIALIAKFALKSNPKEYLVVSTTHLLYNPKRQDVRLAQVQVLLAEIDRLAYIGQKKNKKPIYAPVILSGDFNLQPFTAPYELLTNGFVKFDSLSAKSLDYSKGEECGPNLLPPTLGITDNCQHAAVVQLAMRDRTMLHHSEGKNERPKQCKFDSKNITFNQGFLQHDFNFESAYKHRIGSREQEATTFQGAWVTVDYIFYTRYDNMQSGQGKESDLKLMSTYTLPSLIQCSAIDKIPNLYFGSDHFSTAAKFLLKSSKPKS